MRCPSCRSALDAALLDGRIPVEACAACDGVWIDAVGAKRMVMGRKLVKSGVLRKVGDVLLAMVDIFGKYGG